MIPLPCIYSVAGLPESSVCPITDSSLVCKDRRRSTWTLPAFQTSPFKNSMSIRSTLYPSDPSERRVRTLFPGGFKRPEIRVPTLVLKLSSGDVLAREGSLNMVDSAVSKWVGIVMLECDEDSGGRLYEAACALKSVIRDRAYLVISERVDIAAAAGSSGVVLSDKGADFLIVENDGNSSAKVLVNSICQNVKVPVFTMVDLVGETIPVSDASELLQSGASGIVVSMKLMEMLSDDIVNNLLTSTYVANERSHDGLPIFNKLGLIGVGRASHERMGSVELNLFTEKTKQFIEAERLVLLEAITTIRKAAPMMEEVSLLEDAVARLDDPFLLVIVGEFNSGKSTVINALLGHKYLQDGVVPTTNEITLLSYSAMESNQNELCERHPDGQFICYLPAEILKQMNIVDTPGTNVILQRQQRLTEEFVPRADLILFVISADRPLTESEVAFLRYIQQWKKKVVFVLNKSDIYRDMHELEEATMFIKENAQKLLNTEHVMLYPVSARSALEAKLTVAGKSYAEVLSKDPIWMTSGFSELEKFLFSFLDGSTNTKERVRLKLETPIGIAERLLISSEKLVRKEFELANKDLNSVREIVSSVHDCALKMENESSYWRKQILSLIEAAKDRTVKLTESTLQLSNLDLVVQYFLQGEKSGSFSPNSRIQNEIIGPALSDARRLLQEYLTWLESSNNREGRRYQESFTKRWATSLNSQKVVTSESYELRGGDGLSLKVLEDFSADAAARLFEQEIREVVLGTFGGLGAAGLSASLLTSVLQTTLEDLLALGLCSAGGLLAVSNFPARRKEVMDKVKRVADSLARELEEAMLKDFSQAIEDLQHFVEFIGQPYQEAAQDKLNRLVDVQEELSNVDKKTKAIQIEVQNLHVT
ncbi:probable transmembrane GTPase FZO-like, chloroplastic isoform X2 [Aristolochia californica]|uniref:probable transmembrane GTPase FZO-like, chloroplastic isoform X2 n=1 Tax=Aristolochia californica TaxID=171875 RepID=UPI0035D56EC3